LYLNAHSYYSFKYGTMSPNELLEEARAKGVFTLCLTDINSTAGCLEFVREASKYGIRPILGVDFRNHLQQFYVAIAKNNDGFLEINEHLSRHLKEGAPPIAPCAPQNWQNVTVIYPWDVYKKRPHGLLPHEWIGVKPHEINYLHLQKEDIPKGKLIALSTVTFRHKRDYNTHRLLRAIAENTLLSKLEPWQVAGDADRFYSPAELATIFKETPQLLLNAERIAGESEIFFDFSDDRPHQNLKTYTGSDANDFQLISRLCRDGLSYRYGKPTRQIQERIDKELETIRIKGFVAYFLINWDILRYARNKGYFYVGRGSGANSIVAYLLHITDVDPIELDLYFERFINLYRTNPPDFDIDFSWRDREDVTEYIFNRFPNTALLATFSTFQYKSVARELGKVFGLPSIEIEEMNTSRNSGKVPDELVRKIMGYSQLIHDFPSHLSIHAGGILIGNRPTNYFTATHLPPKGFPTTMFDMVLAEDVGLYKFDILSQRGLGKIKEAINIISENHPADPKIDIHDIKRFKRDERVKGLLREGKAIGCFYVESPAMRMLLKKLKVEDYLGLVAASSIIRPGVARSGMMREYILRFRFPERRKEAHPVMMDIMPETYGIMVYQEDVIKVAHMFAGLSLAEADVLRRGMSGKFRSREEFQQVRERFFSNCSEKGYDQKLTEEVWHQIESFAGYAFSKGHSASYAVESYQSLFLKAYYPLEYMVATLNNGGGFYRPELYAHEAKMHGAVIEAPCVNQSESQTTIKEKTITIGLGAVKDLDGNTIERILGSRAEKGVFLSLEDLVSRTGISLDQLTLLLRVGALRYTGKTKQRLLWESHYMFGKMGGAKSKMQEQQLFGLPSIKDFELPDLTIDPLDNAFDELDLLGYPLCDPFLLLRDIPFEPVMASQLPAYLGKTATMMGYLIATKNTSTLKGDAMHFGTFIDQEGNFIDTTHFPQVARKYPFRGKGFYRLTGKVVDEFGFYSLEVTEMEKEALLSSIKMENA
jgi:DNA-directed DNA polymerase III PolC